MFVPGVRREIDCQARIGLHAPRHSRTFEPSEPGNKLMADYMAESTGIRVTYETVRVHLKAQGIVLSRPQHTITSPDPEYALKKRRSKRPATASGREITSTTPMSST